jgi:hypothetical protein
VALSPGDRSSTSLKVRKHLLAYVAARVPDEKEGLLALEGGEVYPLAFQIWELEL